MADLVTGILSGIGGLGSLFGGNSAQKEANRLRDRELALQERALGNYEKYAKIGQGYRDTGAGYLQKQGGAYQQLGGYGKTDRESAMKLLSQYLPQYAAVSGLPVSQPEKGAEAGAGLAFPKNAPEVKSPHWLFKNLPLTKYRDQEQQAIAAREEALQAPTLPEGFDPYGMTLPQQEQLNQRIDAIRTQEEAAIQEYRAALQQQGLPPNPAGESRIREQLGGLANQERSNFAENARAERAQALQNLIGLAANEKQSGNQLLSEQAGGYGNVAGGYGGYANSAVGQGEGGPYQQIANLYAQQAGQQQERADELRQAMGQDLSLFGGYLRDVFKKPKKPQPTGYPFT